VTFNFASEYDERIKNICHQNPKQLSTNDPQVVHILPLSS
jgi:hypothetical protein